MNKGVCFPSTDVELFSPEISFWTATLHTPFGRSMLRSLSPGQGVISEFNHEKIVMARTCTKRHTRTAVSERVTGGKRAALRLLLDEKWKEGLQGSIPSSQGKSADFPVATITGV